MAKAKAKKPTGALSSREALVFVYLWLNQGSTVSDVRASAPDVGALSVLRKLKARGYVSQRGRLWKVKPRTSELLAIGARLQREGIQAFREPEFRTFGELLAADRKGARE